VTEARLEDAGSGNSTGESPYSFANQHAAPLASEVKPLGIAHVDDEPALRSSGLTSPSSSLAGVYHAEANERPAPEPRSTDVRRVWLSTRCRVVARFPPAGQVVIAA
jgi:hypothetical protein